MPNIRMPKDHQVVSSIMVANCNPRQRKHLVLVIQHISFAVPDIVAAIARIAGADRPNYYIPQNESIF